MNIEKIILKILQGNVQTHLGENIPVVIRQFPLDKTPCITIDSEGGRPSDLPYVLQEKMPLPKNHPQYDKEDPGKLFLQDVYYQKTSDTIIINCWYTDKKDRDIISDRVEELLFLARTQNYMFCTNYNTKTHLCSTSQKKCAALTSQNGLAVKGFCPNPDKYHPHNLLFNNFVFPTTFRIQAVFNQDEYNHNPILYRRIIKLNVDYYKKHYIGGSRWNPNNYIVEE